ncbi:hypothetical protein [Kitasatospora cineracea]|uniref:hypothetical protein n=1 Tax=Kitasatospora cineracea TaxID=88074 RepID=UPI00381DE680
MVSYLIVLGVLGTVPTLLGLAGQAALRRRGGTGASALRGALAGYEEAMRTTSHQARLELRAEADRIAPIAAPDGFHPALGPRTRDARKARLRRRRGRRWRTAR